MALGRRLSPVFFDSENKDSVILNLGILIAAHGTGTGVLRANASDNSKNGVGLVISTTSPTFIAKLQTEGIVRLPDWTLAVGTVSLAPKARYFMSLINGMLTTVAPTTPGQVVQIVGESIDPQSLKLNIEEPVLL